MRQTHQSNSVFAAIWQKYIPSRVSFFLCRLLKGYLATDDSLCLKGFHMVSHCICGQESESIDHLFLKCQKVQPIWRYFHQMMGVIQFSYRSPLALLNRWRRRFRSPHHIGFLLPCHVLWQVWKGRNGFRFDSKVFNANAIIHQVLIELNLTSLAFGFKHSQASNTSDLHNIMNLRIHPPQVRPPRVISWLCPPAGVIKLNVDGCRKGTSGMSAAGGIFRDHRGQVMAAFDCFLGSVPIIYAELWALCEGLRFANDLGYCALEVESDSTTVVPWILSSSSGCWDYIYMVARARQILKSNPIILRHVLREANSAADFMANWSCRHQSSRLFQSHDVLPDGLQGIISLDAMQVPYVRT